MRHDHAIVVLVLTATVALTGCCLTTYVSVGNNTPAEILVCTGSVTTNMTGISPGKAETFRHLAGPIVVSNAVLGHLVFPDVASVEFSSAEYVLDSGLIHGRQTLYVCVATNGLLYLARPGAAATPAKVQSGRYPLKTKQRIR
jgi:hypothetical protein